MLRRLNPIRTVAPVASVVSLSEAKAHLRVDHTDDDALIGTLIDAAEEHLDGWSGVTGRALITQTWAETYSHFARRMPLRLRPVQSIVSVAYRDVDDQAGSVSSAVYRLHQDWGGAWMEERDDAAWPNTFAREDAVTITYVAGFGAAATDVPARIRLAALMLVATWYDHRAAVGPAGLSPVPMAVTDLLGNYRRTMAPGAVR